MSNDPTTPIANHTRQLSWTKGPYEINTDHTQIPIDELNQTFGTADLFWAVPLPERVMREMLANSLCFGVYHHQPSSNSQSKSKTFIGLARCVTDFVTFLYLTDVYVDPAHRSNGLGSWLIGCVRETVDGMPYLRKAMALTGGWDRLVPFYDRVMGMKVIGGKAPEEGKEAGRSLAVLSVNGRGARV